jgi:cytohesin
MLHGDCSSHVLQSDAELEPVTSRFANTPLHIAAGRGNGDAVRLLVNLGADIQLINDNGDTPRTMAEREGHSEIADFLSEAAAREE